MTQKNATERNKKIWILKTKEGKVIEKYRGKYSLMNDKKRLEKIYGELIIERDNSFLDKLKTKIKGEQTPQINEESIK